MNTNGLAKLYDRLTPRERLPLILAASARGDDVEAERLARSAPRRDVRLPDYHGLGEGMLFACLFHLLALLDTALLHWQAAGLQSQASAFLGEDGEACAERLGEAARIYAYLFTVKMDGWRRFCSEFNVDPDFLMQDLPGYETVQRGEEAARRVAFTPDEATAWMRRGGDDAAQVVTAEAVSASLWAFLEQRAEWWG
jgi:hypothetical protein